MPFRLNSSDLGVLNVLNEDSVTIKYSNDGKLVNFSIDSTIEACLTKEQLQTFRTVASPCATLCFFLEDQCITDNGLEWNPRFRLSIPAKDIRVQDSCEPCILQIPMTRDNALAALENSEESTFIPFTTANDYQLKQYQTGGVHVDDNGDPIPFRFLPLVDVIKALAIENFPSCTGIEPEIKGTLTEDYQNEKWCFDTSGLADGDEVEISFQSGLQSVFQYRIELDATEPIEQQIINTLLLTDYPTTGNYSPLVRNLLHQISCAYQDGDTVCIESDFPINNIEYTVNGIPNTFTQLRAFRYGLGNLLISGKGLTSRGIEISWSDISDLICSLGGSISGLQDGAICLDKPNDTYDLTAVDTLPLFEGEGISIGYDTAVMKEKIQLGVGLYDIPDDLEAWRQYGVRDEIFNPTLVDYTYNGSLSGEAYLIGCFTVENTGPATITVNVITTLIRGGVPTIIGSGIGINIDPANPLTLCYSDFNGNAANLTLFDPFFCILPNDIIRIEIIDFPGGNIATTNLISSELFIDVVSGSEGTIPSILPNNGLYVGDNNPYNELIDFAGCTGTLNRSIPSQFAAGLGLLLDAQAQGITDDDSFYLTFADPENPDCTKVFQRCVYFPDDPNAPECFRDKVVTFSFHNTPINYLNLKYCFSQFIPSQIEIPSIGISNRRRSGGLYTSSFSFVDGILPRSTDAINLYRFEHCDPSIDNFYDRVNNGALRFRTCTGEEIAGKIVEANFELPDGNGSYVILG